MLQHPELLRRKFPPYVNLFRVSLKLKREAYAGVHIPTGY